MIATEFHDEPDTLLEVNIAATLTGVLVDRNLKLLLLTLSIFIGFLEKEVPSLVYEFVDYY